jgi:serine/threonine protein kinase
MAHRVSSGDDPSVGLVLDRQFRLEGRVGVGAMAEVYRAHQLGVGRDVAVKILRAQYRDHAEISARFRAEAELVARLSHPHVVGVHAVGEFVDTDAAARARPYVVLEWLAGPSLAEALRDAGGRLPVTRTLHIVLDLADAVGEAHALGIVHRDLKPENVILVRRGDDPDFVKLLDFGLAKAPDKPAELHTRAGSILGTPRYVSPEGAQGQPVTPASDCYSLATLLYQCLAGRTPFEGETAMLLLSQQATQAAPDIRSLEATRGLAAPLARVIMNNLDKRPEARCADARAFGRSLVEAAQSAGLDAAEFGLSSTLLGTRRSAVPAKLHSLELESAESSAPRVLPVEPTSRRDAAASRSSLRQRGTARRVAVFIACFALGVAAAVLVATQATRSRPASNGANP